MTSVFSDLASILSRGRELNSSVFETEFLDLSETNTTSNDLEVTLITCPRLTELKISQCKNLTDDAMVVVGQFALLERLDLSYSQWLTDRGLGHLVELTRLDYLNLTGCSQINFLRKEYTSDVSRFFECLRRKNEQ